MFCDLHMHSTASDGTTPPGQLGKLAKAAGLAAVALTDHDTTNGLADGAHGCSRAGVAFVPGIEVSADPAVNGPADTAERRGTLHILGLFIRPDDPWLEKVQVRMKEARQSRNPAIVEKLRLLGVDIQDDDVLAVADAQGTAILGRPHIAQVLFDKGYVKSIQDAFRQYLGQGAAAYVRRDRLAAEEAIEAIHHAGGLAVMAHPVQMGLREPGLLEHAVARLKDLGLDGIETHHSDHTPALVRQYGDMAKRFNLLTSGGSDFHGSRKDVEMGCANVPIEVYERLKEAAGARSGKGTMGSKNE
jgi:predicted metal-dependent phosphoesterase TrpH